MKRTVSLSFVLTVCGTLINLASYLIAHRFVLCTKLYGGEVIEYTGFGLRLDVIYPLSDGSASVMHYLHADPFSFVICFAGMFAILYTARLLIKR